MEQCVTKHEPGPDRHEGTGRHGAPLRRILRFPVRPASGLTGELGGRRSRPVFLPASAGTFDLLHRAARGLLERRFRFSGGPLGFGGLARFGGCRFGLGGLDGFFGGGSLRLGTGLVEVDAAGGLRFAVGGFRRPGRRGEHDGSVRGGPGTGPGGRLVPAMGVTDGDHRAEDVVPGFGLHHDSVGEHAAIPADVAEGAW